MSTQLQVIVEKMILIFLFSMIITYRFEQSRKKTTQVNSTFTERNIRKRRYIQSFPVGRNRRVLCTYAENKRFLERAKERRTNILAHSRAFLRAFPRTFAHVRFGSHVALARPTTNIFKLLRPRADSFTIDLKGVRGDARVFNILDKGSSSFEYRTFDSRVCDSAK